jgi:hypothetical protein
MMASKRCSAIDQAASGAKLVGGLFILAGGLPMLIAMMDGRSWILQVAGTAATILLVGPGVWYVMASIFLKRKQYWTISTTYRVAMAQIVAVVGVIMAFALFAHWRSASVGFVIVPAFLAVYFVPALIALLFDIRKAARELQATEGHGFAVQVVPADQSPPTQSLDA